MAQPETLEDPLLASQVQRVPERRLGSIAVRGLFGVFDHLVPLNLDERVTVMHGPNGIGKTIMLRMTHELLEQDVDVLARVPFDEFRLEFTNGDRLVVWQERDRAGRDASAGKVTAIKCEAKVDGGIEQVELLSSVNDEVAHEIAKFLPGPWRYDGQGTWIDITDGETIGTKELARRYRQSIPPPLWRSLNSRRGTLMHNLCAATPVRFINTQRLETRIDRASHDIRWASSARNERTATAESFARDLARRISAVLAEYGAVSTRLDRSFVTRLLQSKDIGETAKSARELLERFEALDSKRRELAGLGLLDLEGVDADQPKGGTISQLLADKADIFSLYVDDMERKLKVFDEIKAKLEVLQGRINGRFKYKQMVINQKVGFEFRSPSGARIRGSDLSSGEQHEVILLYELLFVAEDGALVLIDEPEISLHIDWQMEFAEDLRAALRVTSIDILVATHSPAIAGAAEDILVPLVGPTEGA